MRTFDNSKLMVQELSLDEALRNSDGEVISITKTYEMTVIFNTDEISKEEANDIIFNSNPEDLINCKIADERIVIFPSEMANRFMEMMRKTYVK